MVRGQVLLRAVLITQIAFRFFAEPSRSATEPTTEIRVRIMDSRTHRPLNGRRVAISFTGMDGQWYHNSLTMVGRTAVDGVAVFRLRQPVPPRFEIQDLQAYPCSHPEDFSTKEAVEQGVIARVPISIFKFKKVEQWCAADSSAPPPQGQPGEVTFYIHPLNRWQYAWYDIWK